MILTTSFSLRPFQIVKPWISGLRGLPSTHWLHERLESGTMQIQAAKTLKNGLALVCQERRFKTTHRMIFHLKNLWFGAGVVFTVVDTGWIIAATHPYNKQASSTTFVRWYYGFGASRLHRSMKLLAPDPVTRRTWAPTDVLHVSRWIFFALEHGHRCRCHFG